ncbi:DUF4089 domain-containing protein [Microcoleus sp. FACHB-831]|uniref:DUF4089 domain-containing protein n=1 Tax=Microcoleus sp. FACHB-831 TaxID=2692827 RepID=UPI001682F740|nr:DUF4089 domain-containing protein [Microcoleus sp. FACHB-831]MBD1921701.1 DUF4089 domain-containing protein [Microcoleus sp. FACHB-831]
MTDDQIAEYVDLMANLIDLPLDPEYRPGVVANMVRIAQIAQVVTEFSIPNEIEAAPVFEP